MRVCLDESNPALCYATDFYPEPVTLAQRKATKNRQIANTATISGPRQRV